MSKFELLQIDAFKHLQGKPLRTAETWEVPIFENNSASDTSEIGLMAPVSLCMISLSGPTTIIPLSIYDEHHSGMSVLRSNSKEWGIDARDFYPIYVGGVNAVRSSANHEHLVLAAKRWLEAGGGNQNLSLYLTENEHERSKICADLRTFAKTDGKFYNEADIMPIGRRVIQLMTDIERLVQAEIMSFKDSAPLDKKIEELMELASNQIELANIIYNPVYLTITSPERVKNPSPITIELAEMYRDEPVKHRSSARKFISTFREVVENCEDRQKLSEYLLGFGGIKNTIHMAIRNGDLFAFAIFGNLEAADAAFKALEDYGVSPATPIAP